MSTQPTAVSKTANKTAETVMPGKRATIAISERTVRTGTLVKKDTFIKTMTAPTQNLLKQLEDKGIKWQKAFDNTLPAKAKSGPGHSFMFEGTWNGKKVWYDRFQFILFVKDGFPNKRAKAQEVAKMTKVQINKLFFA